MWAAMSSQGVIGPFFFENAAMECQIVNSGRYIDILKRFKASLLRRRDDIDSQWFMQDGATAHTALASRQWLRENFAERVISLKTDFVWGSLFPRP